ncbi:hypothetical protein GCM10027160_23630 [Streptomyces calidiresistens]|uniref:Uncharacterized protein n=1 Tax=Streptomyces calidiresistens TaxID=1485586 RepID=A0A7W3XXN1_9ACTN|nr:hypothetical protein [Streptomyces calidiresistens]MBB0231275.1 hypothetical protein [Streptomyces calidiresistens]
MSPDLLPLFVALAVALALIFAFVRDLVSPLRHRRRLTTAAWKRTRDTQRIRAQESAAAARHAARIKQGADEGILRRITTADNNHPEQRH